MTEFEPEGGKHEPTITPEEYQAVRDGKGTPGQVNRVRAALNNKQSQLWKWLGETAPWARIAIEQKYAIPSVYSESLTPHAQQNFARVIEYLRTKREARVISEEDVNLILKSLRAAHLNGPSSKPSQYAMSVSRLIKAITELHPELEPEVRALPISRRR
jgi:hypothetical protein